MNSTSISPRTLPRPGCSGREAWERGFSLVELLVVVALAAAVITVAVLVFQSLTTAGSMKSSYGTVTVPAMTNFFGGTATTADVFFAPSYGQATKAESLRNQFMDDLQKASAVFCLGRDGVNNTRPATISLSSTLQGSSIDTPEAFRQLLVASVPSASGTFTAYRGASQTTNASIFILVPSQDATQLSVLAVYDIDLTPTTSPAGTYASVKRYEAGVLTDYYDVFYAASSGTVAFKPLIVCFERSARSVTVEGNAIDSLKKAAERPFYFVWWPDPAAHTLEAFSAPSYAATDPRASYAGMGGRTAFFFVVPMFPAL